MGDNFFMKGEKFLRGYVTVSIEGIFLEKFTNLCAVNYLPFWNVKRYGIAKMIGRTSISGYKKMRHIAKKCGCRISINKKRGFPFLLHKYRKRKIFIIGAIAFFILIKISTLFIWDIEVTGQNNNISDEIIIYINELGIGRGTIKSNIDVNEIARNIMIKRNDLSWTGVEIDGIKLKVKVVEKAKVPNRINEKNYCNIIASKAGIITKINTLQGTQLVDINTVVNSGDILVLGIVEMEQFPEKTQFVHSLAEIEARVWYEKSKTLNLSKIRPKEEIEKYAYNIAYTKILEELPNNAKISNVSKKVKLDRNSITVSVIVETLENIGIEEKIQEN